MCADPELAAYMGCNHLVKRHMRVVLWWLFKGQLLPALRGDDDADFPHTEAPKGEGVGT